MLIDVPDPILGSVRLVGPPFKMSGNPEPLTGAAPLLGEHNAEILRESARATRRRGGRAAGRRSRLKWHRRTKSSSSAPSAAHSGSSAAR